MIPTGLLTKIALTSGKDEDLRGLQMFALACTSHVELHSLNREPSGTEAATRSAEMWTMDSLTALASRRCQQCVKLQHLLP